MHKKFRALFPRFFWAFLLMILFLVLASFIGCGGGSSSSGTPPVVSMKVLSGSPDYVSGGD